MTILSPTPASAIEADDVSSGHYRKEPKVAESFRNNKNRLAPPSKKQLALQAARALRRNRELVHLQHDGRTNETEAKHHDCRDDRSVDESFASEDYDEDTYREDATSASDDYSDDDSYDSELDSATATSASEGRTMSTGNSYASHFSDSEVEEEEEEEEAEVGEEEEGSLYTITEEARNLDLLSEEEKDDRQKKKKGAKSEIKAKWSPRAIDEADAVETELGSELNLITGSIPIAFEQQQVNEDEELQKLGNTVRAAARNHLSELEPMPSLPVTKVSSEGRIVDSHSKDLHDAHPSTDDDDLAEAKTAREGEDESTKPDEDFPEDIQIKMRNPSAQLENLIHIALNEPCGSRRMNAYGAMKTMASSDKHAVALAWTKGVLKALSHVLFAQDASDGEIHRSISTLLLLSNHVRNRSLMLIGPDLVAGLVKTLANPSKQISYKTCLCVAKIAKEKGNRIPLSNYAPLLDALTLLIKQSALAGKENTAKDNGDVAMTHEIALTATNVLLDLSKISAVTYTLARNATVTQTFVKVSGCMPESVDVSCQATMANLTRNPENALQLVYHVKGFVSALVSAASCESDARRKYACNALQNLSCESGCRQELGYEPQLLQVLLHCSRTSDHDDEQESALTALDNLSKEPSNLVNFTNNGIVAGLLAHAKDHTKPKLQYLACDTLATLAHWIKETTNAGMVQLVKDGHKPERYLLPTREPVHFEEYK